MLHLPSRRASVISTSERARPVVTAGPVRTVRTDTGQIIRAGESFHIGSGTGTNVFQNAQWAANRAVGLNCMRVGLLDTAAALPINTLLANVATVVGLARANRMYLMLGLFAAAPGAWDDDIPVNRQKWIDVWGPLAARFKDEPHVFYEMVNEPTAWGHTNTYSAAVKSGLRDIFDVMRAAAPETAIVWPSAANLYPSAAQYDTLLQSFNSLGNGTPIDWNKAVFGHHYYNYTMKLALTGTTANATDRGRAALLSLAAKYPMLSTETNWWMEAERKELIDALDLYEEMGIGWVLMRRAGQTTPDGSQHGQGTWPLAPLFLENKIAQLRDRGFTIPVE